MATALSIVSTLYSAYSAYSSSKDQKSAAREAGRIAEQNARLQEEETAETARRMGYQQEQEQDKAAALAAASGVDSGSGSMKNYLGEMSKENTAQLDWLKKAGSNQAALTRRQGRAAMKTGLAQAKATRNQAWGSLMKAGSTVSGSFNNTGGW